MVRSSLVTENRIGDEGAKALAAALSQVPELVHLSLTGALVSLTERWVAEGD